MAKENYNDSENEVNDEIAKPAKGKGSAKISLTMILLIIFGTLVIVILSVRFIILPFVVNSMSDSNHLPVKNQKSAKALEMEFFLNNAKLSQFFQTGRITTNPKASVQFVVVNIGVEYYPKDEDLLEQAKKDKVKEAKLAKENGAEMSPNPSLLPSNGFAQVKAAITSVLGSLTLEELQMKRDSLVYMFKDRIKPIFYSKDFKVKDVIMEEFIIQE